MPEQISDQLGNVVAQVELIKMIKSLSLGTVFALILGQMVKRYSQLVGNKSQYTLIFLTLIPTMILTISVIKSSLALSLGLVGALSIVRFRTPIKEPEELIYIFLSIAVGLGLGADQYRATTLSFFFISALVILWSKFHRKNNEKGIFLEITTKAIDLEIIKSTLAPFVKELDLKKIEKRSDTQFLVFYLNTQNISGLIKELDGLGSEYLLIDQANTI